MQYKSIRFIISLVTSIVMLGHTFVPHHHAEEHTHGHGHYHSHQHESKGVKDLFAHHSHSTDCFTVVQKLEVGKHVYHADPVFVSQDLAYSALKLLYRPIHLNYKTGYIYKPPHLVHLDFRGPPCPSV